MSDEPKPRAFDTLDAALQAIERLEREKERAHRSDREKLKLPMLDEGRVYRLP